jgi:predicted transposase/invertase (TIGR01784 family)
MENRAEVIKMVHLDYTFDTQIMLEKEDSRQEGLEEGRKEGRRSVILAMIRNGRTPEQIAEFCNLSLNEVLDIQNNL